MPIRTVSVTLSFMDSTFLVRPATQVTALKKPRQEENGRLRSVCLGNCLRNQHRTTSDQDDYRPAAFLDAPVLGRQPGYRETA